MYARCQNPAPCPKPPHGSYETNWANNSNCSSANNLFIPAAVLTCVDFEDMLTHIKEKRHLPENTKHGTAGNTIDIYFALYLLLCSLPINCEYSDVCVCVCVCVSLRARFT